MFRNQQQRLHRGLPFFGIVFGLGQFGDIERRVAQRDQRLSGHGSSMGSKNWRDQSAMYTLPPSDVERYTKTGLVGTLPLLIQSGSN
jgi:hypothetical protein